MTQEPPVHVQLLGSFAFPAGPKLPGRGHALAPSGYWSWCS